MGLFGNKKVNPELAGLCNNFQIHIMEALEEIERNGYKYPIPCLDTGMKAIEHIVGQIESDELPAEGKRYYSEVLKRIIEFTPDDWSMQSLFIAYVASFQSATEGQSPNAWLNNNQKELVAAIRQMKMKEMLNIPINAHGSLLDSLYPDLKDRVNELLY